MKKSLFAVCLIASSVSTANAKVGDNEGDEMYFIGGVGKGDNSTGVNLTAGMQYHRHFYIELSSHINSDHTSEVYESTKTYSDSLSVDSSIFTISLTPALMANVTDNLSAYAKGGIYYGRMGIDYDRIKTSKKDNKVVSRQVETTTDTEQVTNYTYGLGLHYMNAKPIIDGAKFTARLGVDWYEIGHLRGINFGREKVYGLQVGIGF